MISTARWILCWVVMAVRPMVGFAKRFELKNNMRLDTMAQLGSEVVVSPAFDPHLIGGFRWHFLHQILLFLSETP